MKGRRNEIDPSAVAALQSNLSTHGKSWIVVGATNILLLIINFLFIGYFYVQYDQVKELTVEVRIKQIRADATSANQLLNAVDQDFADTKRKQLVSNTLSDAAELFKLLAYSDQNFSESITAYLLQIKSFDDTSEASEWFFLQNQRLAPLAERARSRVEIFSAIAESMKNDSLVTIEVGNK